MNTKNRKLAFLKISALTLLTTLSIQSSVYAKDISVSTRVVISPEIQEVKQSQQSVKPGEAINQPKIEVVFVLDTTGSMSGLINAAKEKIWSIAGTMAQASTAPQIKMGLVAYRDRGDAYITKSIDLSDDLDSMYSKLMDFRANGGGDGPETNEAVAGRG